MLSLHFGLGDTVNADRMEINLGPRALWEQQAGGGGDGGCQFDDMQIFCVYTQIHFICISIYLIKVSIV